MAHDFSITKVDNNDVYAFFFGYCGGITYKAFDAKNFNAGMSGSNDAKEVSKDEALKGVEMLIARFQEELDLYSREAELFTDYMNAQILPSNDKEKFKIHFS